MKKEMIIRYRHTQNGFLAESEIGMNKVYIDDENNSRADNIRKSLYDVGGSIIPSNGILECDSPNYPNTIDYIKIIIYNKPFKIET